MTDAAPPNPVEPPDHASRPGRALHAAAFAVLLACGTARCFLAELPFQASALQFVPAPPDATPGATRPAGAANPAAYQADRGELSRMTFAVGILVAGMLWALGGVADGRLEVRHGYLAALMALFAILSLASVLATSSWGATLRSLVEPAGRRGAVEGGANLRAALSGWIEQLSLLAACFLSIQLCPDRKRFVLLVAVLAAVGVTLAGKGFWQLAVEIPERIADFSAHRVERLRQFAWEPDTPQAALVEARLRDRSITGFFGLANPFGSLLLVMAFAAAGLAIDKVRAGAASWRAGRASRRKGEIDLPLVAAGVGVVVAAGVVAAVPLTRSRGAILAALAGVVGFLVVRRWGRGLARHWRKGVLAVAAAAVLGAGAVVAYGLKHDRLPTRTMTFRWYYWTASARIVRDRPWLGVGPGNFANAYLRYRRAAAEEEVQMPHNVVVHALAQYGLPGGVCFVAILGCVLVGCARPHADRRLDAGAPARRWVPAAILAAVLLAAMGARALLSDVAGQPKLLLLDVAVPGAVLAAALVLAAWSGRDLSALGGAPDACRAALGCGAAAFVLHNLVTYSAYLPAPASVFYVAAGACVARSGGGRRRVLAGGRWVAAILAVAAVVAAFVWLWRPVARKTHHTARMLSALRDGDDVAAMGHAAAAAKADPLDPRPAADAAKVALRCSRLPRLRVGRTLVAALDWASEAARRDRHSAGFRRLVGSAAWMLEGARSGPYVRLVARGDEAFLAGRADRARELWTLAERLVARTDASAKAAGAYIRAVQLDPRDSRLRLEAARAFCDTGRPRRALRQLEEAPRIDGQLPRDSMQRLRPHERRELGLLRDRATLLVELMRRPRPPASRPGSAASRATTPSS